MQFTSPGVDTQVSPQDTHGEVQAETKRLLTECCERHGLTLLALETDIDHIHVFVSAPPRFSPALISQEQVTSALGQASRMLQQLQHQHPAIASENPTQAFVLLQSDGQFIATPVVLGLTDGTNYEVLAGLSPGETIIVGVAEPRSPSAPGGSPGGD